MTGNSERIAIFLDWPNIEGSFREIGGQPDVIGLRDYLTAGRSLIEAFVYAGVHPSHVEQCSNFHSFLRGEGFIVKTKLGKLTDDGRSRCDLDVDLALDVLDFVRAARPETVVLGSGDADFIPVVERLRMMGVRVEVAATVSTLSGELRESANGFIDLEQAVIESSRDENAGEGGEGHDDSHYQRPEGGSSA